MPGGKAGNCKLFLRFPGAPPNTHPERGLAFPHLHQVQAHPNLANTAAASGTSWPQKRSSTAVVPKPRCPSESSGLFARETSITFPFGRQIQNCGGVWEHESLTMVPGDYDVTSPSPIAGGSSSMPSFMEVKRRSDVPHVN